MNPGALGLATPACPNGSSPLATLEDEVFKELWRLGSSLSKASRVLGRENWPLHWVSVFQALENNLPLPFPGRARVPRQPNTKAHLCFRPAVPPSPSALVHKPSSILPAFKLPVLPPLNPRPRTVSGWTRGMSAAQEDPGTSPWPWCLAMIPAQDGTHYLGPEAAGTACTGQCQRYRGDSQKSSQQRPPPCCACKEHQSGSQRCRNPRGKKVREGVPDLPASWPPFLFYPKTGSWGSPYWCPRSHGSCWGQANWRGDGTIKVINY